MKMLVGLGNPGPRYERTRHNIGFMVLDKFASSNQILINKKQGSALLGSGFIEGQKVLFVKPQTYMNKSGEAVLEILNYFRDGFEDLIVLHDDLDLNFGRLKFKNGGGSGGHNGLKSISHLLNSPDYARLKIGIGRPPEYLAAEDYVLGSFSEEEKKLLPEIITSAEKGLNTWLFEGSEAAMNKFNSFNIGIEKKEEV